MSNILRGSATRLYIDGTSLTGEKSFSVDMSLRLNEHASFTDTAYEQHSPRLHGWNASANGLLTPEIANRLMSVILSDNPVAPVSFQFGDYTYTGNAIITDLQISGGHKGSAKWSLKLKGTGPLSV